MTFSWVRKTATAAIAATAMLCSVLAADSSAQTVDEIIQSGKLKIGVLAGNPPYDRIDEKGNVVGYGVDLATRIAELMGVEPEIVPLANAARIPALVSGKVDLLIAMLTPTPERAKTVAFTSPYGAYEMRIVAPKSVDISTTDDLQGRSVAVPKGSLQDTTLTAMQIPGLDIKRFDDDALAAQAMLSGQVDAATSNAATAAMIYGEENGSDIEVKIPLFAQYYSMTVRRQDADLLQWLNNTIFYLKTTGELVSIHDKWAGVPLPSVAELGLFPTF